MTPRLSGQSGMGLNYHHVFLSLLLFASSISTIWGQQNNIELNPAIGTPWVNGSTPVFSVVQTNSSNLGGTWTVGALPPVNTALRAIDDNLSDPAIGTVTLGGSVTLRVSDNSNDYDAGNYVGFLIDLSTLALGQSVDVTTYLNGVMRETQTFSTASFGINQFEIGFITSMTYDAIELTYSLAGTGVIQIYHAINKRFAGGSPLTCRVMDTLNQPDYSMIAYGSNAGAICLGGGVSDVSNAISESHSDFAILDVPSGVGCAAYLGIRDVVLDYEPGTFVGFDLENTNFMVGVLDGVLIETYLDGVLQESKSGLDLVSLGLFSNRQTIGFVAGLPFDEARYIQSNTGVSLGSTRIFGLIVEELCEGPPIKCNMPTALSLDSFPVSYSASVQGGCLGGIVGSDNVTSADPSDFATFTTNAGVVCSRSIAVKDNKTVYPAGTFAGFDLANANLVDVNLLTGASIVTYLNGMQQETQTLADIVGAGILSGGRQTLGFVTTMAFNEIQYRQDELVSLSLGETRVYSAVVESYCTGPVLSCNTLTPMVKPAYPALIASEHTGVNSIACVGCSISNEQNVVDSDTNNFATVTLAAGVLTSARLAVRNQLTDFPTNTFVGFDIENITLVDADLLDAIVVKSYLNGMLQETKTGSGLLISATSTLLSGTGRQVVGFVTTTQVDEVEIQFSNLVEADLGTTLVYNALFQTFCPGIVECDSIVPLVNPHQPVVIEGSRTGLTGAACVLCEVENVGNVINSNTDDFALIDLLAGVLTQGAISVRNVVDTFEAGTFVGFTIENLNSLIEADLLGLITITTRLNGIVQESKTALELIDLDVIIPILGSGPDLSTIGFLTTMDFDEATFSMTGLLMEDVSTKVYGAYVQRVISDDCDFDNDGYTNADDLDDDNDGILDVIEDGMSGNLDTDGDGFPNSLDVDADADGCYDAIEGGDSFIASNLDTNHMLLGGVNLSGVPLVVDTINGQTVGTSADMGALDPACMPNTKPIAGDDVATTPEDTSIIVDVQNNDMDPDGNALTTTVVSTTEGGPLPTVLNGDSILYVPPADFVGMDTITYRVCDDGIPSLCDTAIVVVTVTEVNDRPIAGDDVATTPEDTSIIVDVQNNDMDPDGNALTTTVVSTAEGGPLPTVLNGDSILYVPPADFVGMDTITYRVCDDGIPSLCDTAIVVVTVTEVNDKPIAGDDVATTPEDTSIIVDVQNNDMDPDGNALTTTVVSTAEGGPLPTVLNGDSILYVPPADFVGMDTITYRVCDDGIPSLCDTAIVVVTVTEVNDKPIAGDDVATTPEDTSIIVDVQNNDMDPDGNALTTTVASTAEGGPLPTVLNGDSILYVPPADFVGMDTITYRVCDDGIPSLCDTAIVVVTVTEVNDKPIAGDDLATTPEDTSIIVDVQNNDMDPDGNALTTMVVSTTEGGPLPTVLNGDSILYVPPADFVGMDTITYRVCDDGAPSLCDTAIVVVTVTEVNDKPVAGDDVATTPEDVSVVIDVQDNDTDPDGDGLTTSVLSTTAGGLVPMVVDGDSVNYTPRQTLWVWIQLPIEYAMTEHLRYVTPRS